MTGEGTISSMKQLICVCAVASLAFPVPASAAIAPPALKISTEEADPGAAACGVTQAGEIAALQAAMRYNRIEEYAGPSSGSIVDVPTVYLSGNIGKLSGSLCIGSYDVQIYIHVPVPTAWNGGMMMGKVLYCKDGGMRSAGASTFGGDYLNGIKRSFDNCLSKIEKFTISAP